MNDTRTDAPRVFREGSRVFIEVHRDDVEQLQIHLHSLGVRTVPADGSSGDKDRLEVLDHGQQDVEAILGQWEVAKGEAPRIIQFP